MPTHNWTIDDWQGCYPSSWKGKVVPKAMEHPAKFSSRLIDKIYNHMITKGWLKAGDTILDPFGGVALGALYPMLHNLLWVGVELEPKHAKSGNENITLWETFPHTGKAILLQGDSRKLLQVLSGAVNGSVSSPPYAGTPINSFTDDKKRTQEMLKQLKDKGFIEWQGKRYSEKEWRALNHGRIDGRTMRGAKKGSTGYSQAAISSAPYAEARIGQESGQEHAGRGDQYGNGETEGQLGAMNAEGFEVAIASPPFLASGGGMNVPKGMEEKDPGFMARHLAGHALSRAYGDTEGQLQNMSEGSIEAVVTSPPFENQEAAVAGRKFKNPEKTAEEIARKYKDGTFSGHSASKEAILRQLTKANDQVYGTSDGQLGVEAGNNFWMAARLIVEQVYLALVPGGHAVWVCKDYVKNKVRQPFCDQWRQLCEAVGFVTLHEHHALLIRHEGLKQHTLDGGSVDLQKESKSFFRRLAERKGSPRIDYEVVWCMEKPA